MSRCQRRLDRLYRYDIARYGSTARGSRGRRSQIEALRRVAGENVVRLIKRQPDPTIMRIVEGWPRNFDPKRALELGFRADQSFEQIIQIHLEDELKKTASPQPARG